MRQIVKEYDIVLDCDDVLGFISPYWIKLIHDKKDYFSKYFNLVEDFNLDKHFPLVLERDEFFLNKWLMKKDMVLIESEKQEILGRMMELYDNDDFYKNVIPTKFAKGMDEASHQSFIRKVFVVTRSTKNNRNSKDKFIKDVFYNNPGKIEIIHCEPGSKKSDIICTLGDNIKIFADDELGNIEDIVDNCHNLIDTDIYIPKYGYNLPSQELVDKAKGTAKRLLYYDVI